jgi:hypothetical protein
MCGKQKSKFRVNQVVMMKDYDPPRPILLKSVALLGRGYYYKFYLDSDYSGNKVAEESLRRLDNVEIGPRPRGKGRK